LDKKVLGFKWCAMAADPPINTQHEMMWTEGGFEQVVHLFVISAGVVWN